MVMGGGRSRNKYAYRHSDGDDSTESDSQATTDNETEDDARAEMENALVQSALARIRKARARGREDVKLNKGELAALERRRKRLQLEADSAARRRKASDRQRRQEKEQRVAVPLSHFDSGLSDHRALPTSDDALPRHPLPSTIQGQGQPGPPIGLFPPPHNTSPRPRSSTSSSHRSSYQRQGSSSPFDYQYVSPTSSRRHASDTPTPSSFKVPLDEDWQPRSSPSHPAVDPFQYQTAGPSVPYPTGVAYSTFGEAARSGSRETTPERDDPGSDNHRTDGPASRNISQEEVIVIEAGSSPEQELEGSRWKKTASRNSSPGKRKSGSRGGSRRRRDK
ncbi:hypothetical protein F4802DRAFT_397595 [Xylaria palmicola]|nr:hypothetical protein F4802DRAFT_397595 [Xylaria palmicola]